MTFLDAQQAFINIHHPQFKQNSSKKGELASKESKGLAGRIAFSKTFSAKTVDDSVANSNKNEV